MKYEICENEYFLHKKALITCFFEIIFLYIRQTYLSLYDYKLLTISKSICLVYNNSGEICI